MSNQSNPMIETRTEGLQTGNSSQARSWVDRLTYPQKFILISLIFVLPVIAFVPLVVEQSTYIQQYGHQEADGTIYLRSIWQTKNSLQTLQHTMDEYVKGNKQLTDVEEAENKVEESIQELEKVDLKYRESLALNFDIKDLKTQWQELKAAAPDETSFEQVENIISIMDAATKEVGDASYLILDPDLDTYYMMDTVLLNMPESQDVLFDIFLISNSAVRNQKISPEEEAQLTVLVGRLEAGIKNLESNIQTATQNNSSGAMLPLINDPSQNYIRTILAFSGRIKDSLASGEFQQFTPEEIESLFNTAQQASDTFYTAASDALFIGIQARIARLNIRLYTVTGIAIISVLVAFSIGISVMRAISAPLAQLISATKRIASGELSARISVERNDEIGELARSFNQMAQKLQDDSNAIEFRTRELEDARQQSEFSTKQLQVVTELTATITQVHNISELFPVATELISEKFSFYHVGIFLVDSDKKYAILQAANSEGGKHMLARGHRLRLGVGVVGFSAQTGRPRIALDVGNDSVFSNNPDLPNTRSEIALPLTLRGETIGVLDVQSTKPGAFANEDLQALTTLANQVSIAFENAHLLSETRAALEQVQEVYSEFTRAEWSRTLAKAEQSGFRYQAGRIEMLDNEIQETEAIAAIRSGNVAQNQDKRATVAVPVKLRGEVIGVLHIESNDPSKAWQSDEISLVEAVAERAAFAMENARLFQDARKRASKERLISEATSRISSALDIENILQTTAAELEHVLGGSEVLIQFQNKEQSQT